MPIYKVNGKKKDGLQKYTVRVNYISDGKPKQLTRAAYGLEVAKQLERQLNSALKSKAETPARKMTIQQLFDEYISVRQYEIRETSLDKCKRNFEYYILPTFKNIRIDKISADLLRDWKLSIEKKALSLSTRKQAFSDFRALLNYAIRMEYLSKNPLTKLGNFKGSLEIKPEMNFYTSEEFKRFIDAAEKNAAAKQVRYKDLSEWDFYVFFNIAFYTGLRKGEIHALKWTDIDGSYLSVKRSITQRLSGEDRETPPKNKSSIRTLQMPLPLIRVLNDHKNRQKQLKNFSDEYRLCGGEKSLRNTTIQRRNELNAKQSSLKVIRIHDYRHSHASLLANAGVNIQEIARRLGHSKIEITWNTYSHLYPREEEKAVEVLNKIN